MSMSLFGSQNSVEPALTSGHPDLQSRTPKREDDAMSLSLLMKIIGGAIQESFPQAMWVKAEISSISHSNHLYLDLVEYGPDGKEIAKTRAVAWAREAADLLKKFEAGAGVKLAKNIKVLLKVAVTFHPQYGVSLRIADIDPAYTAGEMAAKLKAIRDTLVKDGLYDRNKQLASPFDFFRVAVISPDGAAGLADFMKEADRWSEAGVCEFVNVVATFQGQQASGSLVRAFNQVLRAHEEQAFDAIVVIRGGGAAADLAWLNDLEIAKQICLSPCPVFTGIGHQIDNTILDEVAFQRFDTPSKVSAHINDTIINNAAIGINSMQMIASGVLAAVAHAETRVDGLMRETSGAAARHLDNAEQRADRLLNDTFSLAEYQVGIAEQQTNALMAEILGMSPRNTLARGYAVVRTKNGTVSTAAAARAAGELEIEFQDGTVTAQVAKEMS